MTGCLGVDDALTKYYHLPHVRGLCPIANPCVPIGQRWRRLALTGRIVPVRGYTNVKDK